MAVSKTGFYTKAIITTAAIFLLLWKSDEHYSNILLAVLLCGLGFYLGKITCSMHAKSASLGITLALFILMNLIHSFIDGLSFDGNVSYWLGALSGHELIRQPTMYIMLWTLLYPLNVKCYVKALICFLSITGIWVTGLLFGKHFGFYLSHFSLKGQWMQYTIFLFIGDIIHHLTDQYKFLSIQKNNN